MATMAAHLVPNPSSGSHAAGFTLVELLVALALGLLIIGGMFTAYLSASWTTDTNARFTEVQNNGRYAIDYLRREIQLAGFLGMQNSDVFNKTPGAVTRVGTIASQAYGNCGTQGFATLIEQPVWGVDDAVMPSCTAMSNYLRGDVLVLRRAGLNAVAASAGSLPAVSGSTLYVRVDPSHATVYLGSDQSQLSAVTRAGETYTPEYYPLEVDVYYVSNCTSSPCESPNVPALYRLTLGAGPTFAPQLIATGIENMQVQYGVRSGTDVIFRNAGAVAAAEWPTIVSLRVWLLARSADIEGGYAGTASYAMGNQTYPASGSSDSYVRQVFPLVIGVRH